MASEKERATDEAEVRLSIAMTKLAEIEAIVSKGVGVADFTTLSLSLHQIYEVINTRTEIPQSAYTRMPGPGIPCYWDGYKWCRTGPLKGMFCPFRSHEGHDVICTPERCGMGMRVRSGDPMECAHVVRAKLAHKKVSHDQANINIEVKEDGDHWMASTYVNGCMYVGTGKSKAAAKDRLQLYLEEAAAEGRL